MQIIVHSINRRCTLLLTGRHCNQISSLYIPLGTKRSPTQTDTYIIHLRKTVLYYISPNSQLSTYIQKVRENLIIQITHPQSHYKTHIQAATAVRIYICVQFEDFLLGSYVCSESCLDAFVRFTSKLVAAQAHNIQKVIARIQSKRKHNPTTYIVYICNYTRICRSCMPEWLAKQYRVLTHTCILGSWHVK